MFFFVENKLVVASKKRTTTTTLFITLSFSSLLDYTRYMYLYIVEVNTSINNIICLLSAICS